MLDQIESKTMHKDKEGDSQRKTSKTLSEVKPVENISKNLQSFLEISPVQKEVFPSHKLPESIALSTFVSHRARMSGRRV